MFQEHLKNQLFKLLSPTLTPICSLCLPNIYPGSHLKSLLLITGTTKSSYIYKLVPSSNTTAFDQASSLFFCVFYYVPYHLTSNLILHFHTNRVTFPKWKTDLTPLVQKLSTAHQQFLDKIQPPQRGIKIFTIQRRLGGSVG